MKVDEQLLRSVLGALPEFVVVVDRERSIRFVSRVAPEYDPSDFLGKSAEETLFLESRDVLRQALDLVFESGEAQSYEVEARLPDGTVAWYHGEAKPLVESGEVVGAVIRVDDITELRDVKEELAQIRRLLPMCAWCGRIQTEDGSWEGISSYLKRVEGTDVSHGLCPECERGQLEKAGAR